MTPNAAVQRPRAAVRCAARAHNEMARSRRRRADLSRSAATACYTAPGSLRTTPPFLLKQDAANVVRHEREDCLARSRPPELVRLDERKRNSVLDLCDCVGLAQRFADERAYLQRQVSVAG